MGVWSAETRRKGGAACSACASPSCSGSVFLGIKGIEWHEKMGEAPRSRHSTTACSRFSIPPRTPRSISSIRRQAAGARHGAPRPRMYFFLYFAMTGMHALHMVIGIAILGFMIFRAQAGAYTTGHVTFVENFGLYWHFVDIIWIYLFAAAVSDQQACEGQDWHMSEHTTNRTRAPHRQPHDLPDHPLRAAGGHGVYRVGRPTSTSASGTSLPGLTPLLESGGRAGHRLHQGHPGGAVLHACEVQHQADQAHRGLRASSCSWC